MISTLPEVKSFVEPDQVYPNCFGAFTLPTEYEERFLDHSYWISEQVPATKLHLPLNRADHIRGHLTDYRLLDRKGSELLEIAQTIAVCGQAVAEEPMKLVGFKEMRYKGKGYLMLDAHKLKHLLRFHLDLEEAFDIPQVDPAYDLHLTLKILESEQAHEEYHNASRQIRARLEPENWEFPITNFGLFGWVPGGPRHPVQLVNIPLDRV